MKPLCWLVAVSAVVVLSVFVAPPTRRAAFEQARIVLGLTAPESYLWPYSGDNDIVPYALEARRAAAYRRVAESHPDDVAVQMAVAVEPVSFSITEFPKAIVARLRPLQVRYPKSPELYAALLQHGSQCLGDVGNEYRAASPKYQPMRDAIDPRPAHPSPRVSFADFDAWAVAGERLDPHNAFFPAMRAVGFSQQHRREDALTAMERAATKDRWSEYDRELAAAVFNLPREAYGRTDPFVSPGVVSMMPDSSTLRNALFETTRDASRTAVAAGHIEEGLRIRRSAWKLARLWRLHSGTAIDAMSSTVVTSAALDGLGGTVKRDTRLTDEAQRAANRRVILAYLERTGHTADADYLRRDMADRDEMYGIIKAGSAKSNSVGVMVQAMATWIAAVALLGVAFWMALFGVAASWVSGAKERRNKRVLASFVVLMALAVWQAYGSQGFGGPSPLRLAPLALTLLGLALFVFTVPFTLAVVLSITALVRRKPFRKSVSAWLRASLIPTACVAALLFVAVSFWGVKPQRAFREYVEGQVTHEGRYFAHLIGKTWPE